MVSVLLPGNFLSLGESGVSAGQTTSAFIVVNNDLPPVKLSAAPGKVLF